MIVLARKMSTANGTQQKKLSAESTCPETIHNKKITLARKKAHQKSYQLYLYHNQITSLTHYKVNLKS